MNTRAVCGFGFRVLTSTVAAALTAAAFILLFPAPLRAASGIWNGTQDAYWTNSANWSASPYPSGGNTATFNNAGNGRTALSAEGLSTLLNMTFTGPSVAAYTVGSAGQKVTLQADGTILLAADAANSQSVLADLELPTGTVASTFRNDNPDRTLTLGRIHGYTAGGVVKSLYFDGAGPMIVQGNLDRMASTIHVYHRTTNTLSFTGAAAGLTQLALDGAGALLNLGTGTVMTFANGGSANLTASQNATINGPGELVLSAAGVDDHGNIAVASGHTLTLNARLTGDTGFQYYHASSDYAGTVVLNGMNDYARSTVLYAAGTLSCAYLGMSGTAGNIGTNARVVLDHPGARLLYTGAGETNDRTLDIKRGGTLEHAGSGTLVFTAPTTSTTSGAKTLTLRNFAAADGELRGAAVNGSGTVSLAKEGDGIWSLTASNTFSGTLAVNGGTIVLSGADGAAASAAACTVSNGATLRLDNTAAANHTDRLNDAGAVTLLGGTLDFSHDAGAADFSETAGALTAASGACTVQTDPAAEGRTSALTFASLGQLNGATLNFAGTGLGANGRNRVFITGQPEGPLGSWVTLNGQPAYYSVADGVTAMPAWSVTEIAARGPASVIPNDAAADVRITQPGTSGPITLAGDPVNSVAYLRQCTDTAAEVDTANKTLFAYSVGITNGQAALMLGLAVGDGALAPLTAGGSLELNNDSGSALTVNAALADNGAASAVIKNGTGNALIAGPTLHTGATVLNAGTLTFAGHDTTQRLAGAVSGSGTLVKTGTNLFDLAAANSGFTGQALLQQGLTRVAQSGALGTADGGTVIADGATLDLGGAAAADALNLQQEPITVSGAGAGGAGAIINSSANRQINALGTVTLDADTTFGGPGRWDIRNGTLAMNGHAITKTGASAVAVSGSTVVMPGGDTATIDVQEGAFRLQQTAQTGGSAANTVSLGSGTAIEFYDLVNQPAWSLVCEDNTRYHIDNSASDSHNRWGGPVTLNGTLTLTSDGSFRGGFAGEISGSGSLFKTNDLYFFITGTNNTYSGTTRVVGGWLYVNSLRNVGEPSSLGQPMNAADGTIRLGGGGTPGRIVYRGTGDVTDRVIDMAGTTGWTTLSHEGTGPLVISNLTVSTAGSKMLYLIGPSTSTAEIVSGVVNSPSGATTLEKQNAGTWILSGDCTYSGSTTVTDGHLIFNGNNTLAGSTALNKGKLTYTGNNILNGNLEVKNGTATVTGTNAHTSGSILLGNLNNGVLKLLDNARLSCTSNLRVGGAGNSHGALYIDGGAFSNSQAAGENNVNIGCENNAYGYLRMTGGSLSAGRIQTGGYSGGTACGTGVVRIEGGTLTFPDWIILGRRVGGKSAVTLDGGTFTHGASGEFAFCRNGGDCEVNVTGGTLNNPSAAITFHNLDTGAGTGIVNLCAGRLTTRNFYNKTSYATNGGAYLMFGGGTLAASADYSTFVPVTMSGVYSFDAFGSFAGGAVIDSNGKNITIPAAIRKPTGQSVVSIALAAQGSGYIGEPYVLIEGDGVGASAVANLADDGTGKGTFKIAGITMTCPGVDYSAAPTVTLRGGGTNVTAAVIGTVTLGTNVGGGLTKLGTGTLSLSGANTYAGATTVSNGTLHLAAAEALPAGTDLNVAGGTLDLGGFSRTNGAFTASAGVIANGVLTLDSFTKTGTGTLILAASVDTDVPLLIENGTLRLASATPGLLEGPLSGAFNTTESLSTNILVQLTTRMANVNTQPPWSSNVTYLYTGYLWNRSESDVTWTFGENIDDSALLKIDGVTVLNNSVHNVPTIGSHTLTPGPHAFEARFGNGGGGAGRVYSAWWTTSLFGFGIDYQGRNETNIANFVALTDPGDGSLLTTGTSASNWLAEALSVQIAGGATLDLGGTVQTLSGIDGSGTVSNGTLAVTGDLWPGGDGTLGTLKLVDGSVSGSATLHVDVTAGGLCDRLEVDGDIDLSGLSLTVANPNDLARGQTYTLLTCSDTRTGTFSSVTVPDSRWHVVYRSDGSVQLLFAGGTLIKVR